MNTPSFMSTASSTQANSAFKPGLEGVIAAETKLSLVDGQKGELIIGGYPVEVLADKATFEETVYLLWYGALPTVEELTTFKQRLADYRALPAPALPLLAAIAAEKRAPMDALRMVAGVADLGQTENALGQTKNVLGEKAQAQQLLARLSTIVATYWRLLQGQLPVTPDPALGYAANYLYLLTGTRPTPAQERGLETYLNTVVDHGLNASTFAARVIIATGTDLTSALVGGIGALKGPLHGGAPGPALDMVFEIGEPSRAEAYLRAKLARGERLMGFGHRIYKVRDPRAEVLAQAAEKLFMGGGDLALYALVKHVEKLAVALLKEHKPGLNLQTNVEFYTALLLHGLGLPTDLFTPTFAISRAAGWIAHCFEQQATRRIIRPDSRYVGPRFEAWTPLEAR